MVNQNSLTKIPIFSHLTQRERRKIAKDMVETKYTKGQVIFCEGDRAESFHILTEGSVKCTKTAHNGKQVTMKVLMPGDLFCCDAAVFSGGTHPGCAQSLNDVSVMKLKKQDYVRMVQNNPPVALEIIRYLGDRLTEAQEKAKVLALAPAEQRLAGLLVSLAHEVGEHGPQGIRLSIRLTRQDLADLIGITIETTIRIMSRFRKQVLVSGTANSLVIRNLAALHQKATAPSPALPDL